MNGESRIRLATLAVLAFLPAGIRAQDLFSVTGLSRPGAATWTPADGTAGELAVGQPVGPGRLTVAPEAQVMLYEPSGAALVVLGPADLTVERDAVQDEILLQLRAGKLACASDRAAGAGRALLLGAAVAAQPPVSLQCLVGPGQTFLACDAAGATLGYLGDPAAGGLTVSVGSSSLALATGQLLTVERSGQSQVASLGAWLAEQGFDRAWGRDLGVRSAQVARHDVESNLFQTIISWDRYAGAAYVAAQIRPAPPSFEIRQTVQTVTTVTRPTGRGGAVQTEPTAGANEVPVLSPAAASVQNLREVGGGVTAIELNRNASALLSATGSQGLGFRGLRLLAIPGSQGGIPTVGPPGLGGQN